MSNFRPPWPYCFCIRMLFRHGPTTHDETVIQDFITVYQQLIPTRQANIRVATKYKNLTEVRKGNRIEDEMMEARVLNRHVNPPAKRRRK